MKTKIIEGDIKVEFDMYLLDTDDVMEYVIDYLDLDDIPYIDEVKLLKRLLEGMHDIKIDSIDDMAKFEHFGKIFKNYTVEQIETLLP